MSLHIFIRCKYTDRSQSAGSNSSLRALARYTYIYTREFFRCPVAGSCRKLLLPLFGGDESFAFFFDQDEKVKFCFGAFFFTRDALFVIVVCFFFRDRMQIRDYLEENANEQWMRCGKSGRLDSRGKFCGSWHVEYHCKVAVIILLR